MLQIFSSSVRKLSKIQRSSDIIQGLIVIVLYFLLIALNPTKLKYSVVLNYLENLRNKIPRQFSRFMYKQTIISNKTSSDNPWYVRVSISFSFYSILFHSTSSLKEKKKKKKKKKPWKDPVKQRFAEGTIVKHRRDEIRIASVQQPVDGGGESLEERPLIAVFPPRGGAPSIRGARRIVAFIISSDVLGIFPPGCWIQMASLSLSNRAARLIPQRKHGEQPAIKRERQVIKRI